MVSKGWNVDPIGSFAMVQYVAWIQCTGYRSRPAYVTLTIRTRWSPDLPVAGGAMLEIYGGAGMLVDHRSIHRKHTFFGRGIFAAVLRPSREGFKTIEPTT